MKNLFGWMLVVLLVLTAGVSCSDDEELLAGNGIADAAWSAENQVEIEGGVLNYTFAAASDWTARSSADWCEVQTGSGMAGSSFRDDYRQCVGICFAGFVRGEAGQRIN